MAISVDMSSRVCVPLPILHGCVQIHSQWVAPTSYTEVLNIIWCHLYKYDACCMRFDNLHDRTECQKWWNSLYSIPSCLAGMLTNKSAYSYMTSASTGGVTVASSLLPWIRCLHNFYGKCRSYLFRKISGLCACIDSLKYLGATHTHHANIALDC